MSDIDFTKPMTSSEAMKYGFIEPPTWNETLNSQEYKNYRGLIEKILGTDIKNYTDKEIAGFALITNSFSHKLRDPYIQNASKIGLHYKSNNEDIEEYLSKKAIKDFRQPEFKKLDEDFRQDLEDFIFGDISNTILSRNAENNQENVNKIINDFIDSSDNSINYEEARSTKTDNNRFINNKIDRKLASTKEAREVFDKAIENDPDSSSVFNDIIKNNKVTDENYRYSHGLLAFTTSEGGTQNTVKSARKNLEFILENPEAQIAATSDIFRLGNIGISGTAVSHGRAGFDLATKPTVNNGRTSILNLKKALHRHSSYDENIVSEFKPDTIWVKDNEWSKENIKDIVDLAKEKNINKLQIIRSRSDISDFASISDHSSFILHETNINDISEDEFIEKWLEDEENPFIKKETENFDPEDIESTELGNTDLTKFDTETLEPIDDIDDYDPLKDNFGEDDYNEYEEDDDYDPLEDNHNPPEDDYDPSEDDYDTDYDPLEDNFPLEEDDYYLTEQEAFDKYKDSNEFKETGIMPDEFYIDQGLDPEEQKEAIRQLNTLKKSKPVNEIAKETQITEDTQITIEEAINRNIDIEPSIESLKEESQEILNDIKEEIPEKTQELTSAIENTDNLAHKTLSNNSKIALGIAAAVAVGTIAIAGTKKNSEKEKKQEENTYNPQMKYQNYYYPNDFNENDSDIAYNITKYRYGHRNIM